MKRLNPEKLKVTFLNGTAAGDGGLPRRYTLTHSDRTGELFLTIGNDYDRKQISGLYTRLMRDEVLAELTNSGDRPEFRVYCHVSGGFVIGTARWRYNIFRQELQLVLEALRYGDRALFAGNPGLDNAPVTVHFHSKDKKYDKAQNYGTIAEYQ